jgi:hypothetical protein
MKRAGWLAHRHVIGSRAGGARPRLDRASRLAGFWLFSKGWGSDDFILRFQLEFVTGLTGKYVHFSGQCAPICHVFHSRCAASHTISATTMGGGSSTVCQPVLPSELMCAHIHRWHSFDITARH